MECTGGVFFLFRGGELNDKKITKIKYDEGLRWPPFNILRAINNQKHVGVTEGGLDRPRDRARTSRERDGNDEPLAEGDDDDNDEYDEDGDITDDDDEYVVGIDGVDEPLDKGNDEYDTLSAAPAPACPESQRLSSALALRASYSQQAALRV